MVLPSPPSLRSVMGENSIPYYQELLVGVAMDNIGDGMRAVQVHSLQAVRSLRAEAWVPMSCKKHTTSVDATCVRESY